MSLQKVVKGLLSVVVPVAVGYAGCTGLNFHQHHNLNYVNVDGTRNCSKADGIFAHTELSMYKDDHVIVSRFSPLRMYWDNNNDGKVDHAYLEVQHGFLGRNSHYEDLFRDKHLTQYTLVFQEADKDFKEQMERFKTLCR